MTRNNTIFFELFRGHFGASMYDEMMTLWREAHEYDTCEAFVKSGDRAGQICGKACITGQEYCLCHTPRVEVDKHICGKELITGKNKGKTCLRTCSDKNEFCSLHMKEKADGPVCSFTILRGARANQVCGKSCNGSEYCLRHTEKVNILDAEKEENEVKIKVEKAEKAEKREKRLAKKVKKEKAYKSDKDVSENDVNDANDVNKVADTKVNVEKFKVVKKKGTA